MKKILSFVCLASLIGLFGCAPASTSPPATETPPAEQPATDESAADELPPRGHFVQADPKLATLKAKFVYDGAPPARAKVDSSKDPFCAQLEILSDELLVGKDGGLQNLVLMLDERRSKVEIPDSQKKPPAGVATLDNNGCRFEPHVFFAQVGQTVEILNSDQTGHNANFGFLNNPGLNVLIPIGGKKEVTLVADEPTLIPVDCNIHPWMKAHIIVQEHPFVGISNEQGEIEIINLPVGEVTFLIRHESADGSIDEGTVDGKAQKWSRGRMEIELKPGVNDLGTIKLSPDKFKK